MHCFTFTECAPKEFKEVSFRFPEPSNLLVFQDPSQSWEYRSGPQEPGNLTCLLNGCIRCQLDPLKTKNRQQVSNSSYFKKQICLED